jgi:hypothetical protein
LSGLKDYDSIFTTWLAGRSARQDRDTLIALRELIDEASREIDVFKRPCERRLCAGPLAISRSYRPTEHVIVRRAKRLLVSLTATAWLHQRFGNEQSVRNNLPTEQEREEGPQTVIFSNRERSRAPSLQLEDEICNPATSVAISPSELE